MNESYYDVTGRKINSRTWNDLARRYGVQGDDIMMGRTLLAYRRRRAISERDKVIAEGRY